MKILLNITAFYFLIWLLLFTGCTRVQETLYLREADVSGGLPNIPVHLTDSTASRITISPRFSFNTKNTLTGDVQQRSQYYTLDTTYVPAESSLNWDISVIHAGLDFDFVVTRGFAISLGLNYSSQANHSTIGGNAGIGFFSYGDGTAFRIDMGLKINSMRYDAHTVVHQVSTNFFGSDDEFIGFFHDVGKSTHFDPFINFTFNTHVNDWFINFFLNAGYAVQSLFSFEPRTQYLLMGHYTKTDLRGSSTAGFFNVTPGVYFNFGESGRILLGSRFYIETLIDNADPKLFVLPMVQFDFGL